MANEKRLIDANDLKNEMSEENPYIRFGPFGYCACSPKTDGELVFKREEVLRAIDSAPTVDAVEVVHGRWISSGCGFDCCSECRKVYTDGYFTAMGIKPRAQFNYCPNCGAKMDGGNEDV